MRMKKNILVSVMCLLLPGMIWGGETLTLQQCREMALASNRTLQGEHVKAEMAGYDRKTAMANYLPDISLKGGYFYNSTDISLISDEQSAALRGMGTAVQGRLGEATTALTQAIMTNPQAAFEYMNSAMWQTALGALSQTDVTTALNALGAQIDDALHPDLRNVGGALLTLKQPLFVGGKIVASNRIARLAEELAEARCDEQQRHVLTDVDNAYWQVVSIAAKKRLADDYAALLSQMVSNVQTAADEGVATSSDVLAVRVKANEAQMLQTRSTDGLRLARMLLCQQIGLPLESDIVLADEQAEMLTVPEVAARHSLDEICQNRPEMRQLSLAEQIYRKKVDVARADMMPTVALTANYLCSNPNLLSGFRNEWGGTWNAGVVVTMPLFHGTEALQKTRRAKAEVMLYQLKKDDAREMIDLQVSQLRCRYDEAKKRLDMADSNLECANENLRTATLGFEEGVITSDVAMAAQTAWLQARSESIDAHIELQMTALEIAMAEN